MLSKDKRYGPQEIAKVVAKHFGVSAAELSRQKSDRRNLLIYLMKNQTCLTNREIGDFIGGLSCSGVSKAEQRLVEKLKKNRALKKDLKAVLGRISNVKG